MKNLTLLTAFIIINVIIVPNVTFGQGNIQGVIKDSLSHKVLPFASVALKQNEKIVFSTTTDYDGLYFFDNITNGTYALVLNYAGKTKEFSNIVITNGSVYYTLEIDPANELDVVIVHGHAGLIIPERIDKYDADFLEDNGIINITEIEALGVAQVETSEGISYKGARPGTSVYYIDGMRTYGDLYIPMNAVESVVVYNSGIPALYGNTTSAVIVVETKSYLNDF